MIIISFFSFIFIYIGGQHYFYYAIPFATFVPFGIAFIDTNIQTQLNKYQNVKNKLPFFYTKKWKTIYIILLCLLSFIILIFIPPCAPFKTYTKKDTPQYQFAKIINQKDNSTLLTYGIVDAGFYTASDIIPTVKYFCGLNIPKKKK